MCTAPGSPVGQRSEDAARMPVPALRQHGMHTKDTQIAVLDASQTDRGEFAIQPRNGSWTGASVRFSDALARRDDDAGLILLGEATPPESLKNVQSHP